MIDNSWTNTDRKTSSAQSKIMKTKVILTVAIIVVGTIGTIALYGVGSNATQYRSEGIVIDFGDYLTIWTDAGVSGDKDPITLLESAKTQHMSRGFDYTMDGDNLVSITYNDTTYTNNGTSTWNLWAISDGEFDAAVIEDHSVDVSDYTVVIWAFTTADGKPMPAVDATATSIYGYAEPMRVVTLSPVCTETVHSVRGVQKIVGTDVYSDYPELVRIGHDNGTIATVGSFTDPSYESIMSTSPEMVFCDASTYNQVQMADMLRASNVNSVVLYNGEDIETIYKNVFIAGNAIGYNLAAQAYVQKLNYYVQTLHDLAMTVDGSSVMASLGSEPSPWIAGNYTYVNDMIQELNSSNVFGSAVGWKNITPESIHDKNPNCIIVIDSGTYGIDGYDRMLSNLSSEWKSTDAYNNDRIYLLCEDLGSLASRAGPRFIQLMEIMCKIVAPGAAYSIPIPETGMAIGNNYHDYLEMTGGME